MAPGGAGGIFSGNSKNNFKQGSFELAMQCDSVSDRATTGIQVESSLSIKAYTTNLEELLSISWIQTPLWIDRNCSHLGGCW